MIQSLLSRLRPKPPQDQRPTVDTVTSAQPLQPLVMTGPEPHFVTIEAADVKTIEIITGSDLTRAAFTVFSGSDGHRYKLAMSQKLEYQGMYKLTFIQLPSEEQ